MSRDPSASGPRVPWAGASFDTSSARSCTDAMLLTSRSLKAVSQYTGRLRTGQGVCKFHPVNSAGHEWLTSMSSSACCDSCIGICLAA
jgi:hypothetical protein